MCLHRAPEVCLYQMQFYGMFEKTMSNNTKLNPADYIMPFTIGGLDGRMLRIPAQARSGDDGASPKREILFIYGHHSTLERWWGLMEVLSEYGTVTMPDLPGFGGMDSYYKVNQRPTIDALADYLAAFIKWRYKRKKVTIAGMSFGFVVATRMLQRYPELTRKVDLLVSIVGFAHYQDFTFSPTRHRMYLAASTILSRNPTAWLFRHIALTRPVLRLAYSRTHNAKKKFAAATTPQEFNDMMDVEVKLWQSNDVRTHMLTTAQFLKVDNCTKQVDLPVWHVSSDNDHFFDHTVVEQHMRIIFNDFHEAPTTLQNHAPSVIADAAMAAPLLPKALRDVLAMPPKA